MASQCNPNTVTPKTSPKTSPQTGPQTRTTTAGAGAAAAAAAAAGAAGAAGAAANNNEEEDRPHHVATTAHPPRATRDDSAPRGGEGRGQGGVEEGGAGASTSTGACPSSPKSATGVTEDHHHHHHLHNAGAVDEDSEQDDAASDFSSISEDSLPPIRAFGYTYHGSGRIMLPNDESGSQHMALFHELYKLCLGGRLTDSKLRIEGPAQSVNGAGGANGGPDHDPFTILDIGSGNGLWAVEMARTFPSAEILGVDLSSALLPKDVPPNLTFEVTDMTERPWGPRLYDLIHMRNPVGGGVTDWPALIAEAWAHLKPGGQIELSSMRPRFYGGATPDDDQRPPVAGAPAPEIGSACREFEIAFGAMCEAQGIDFDPLSRIGVTLTRLGAESVRERGDWLPVRNWGGDPITRRKGELAEQIIDVGLDQWALMLFSRCGWDEADTRQLLQRVKDEIGDPKTRSMFRLVFVTARKPIQSASR